MQKKIKTIANIIECIGFIVFGIANIFAGVYLWNDYPALAVGIYALSLVCIARGISRLADIAK